MKKIKNIIIMLVILIIIILLTIIILKVNKINKEKQIDEAGDEGEELVLTNEIETVSERTKFNTVENCIQLYYNALNTEYSDFFYEEDDNDGNIVNNEADAVIKQRILNLLSQKYKNENNIDLNNINNYIKTVDENVMAIALKMKVLVDAPVEKYVVYGFITNLDYKVIDGFYILVNLDTEEKTFSIEPINESYKSIDEIEFENENTSIEANEDNKYNETVLNYEQVAKKYFSNYKKIILAAPKVIYNYLEEDYREQRFGSYEKFQEYVVENKEEIEGIRFEEYLVNDYEDTTQFVCKDQYENLYIFNETLPMQFTLRLDTYTLTTDTFKTAYNAGNAQKKVAMNIDKWVQMLNNRDYDAAYNVLDETFRNSKWGSLDNFKNYMKEKFPLHYKVEYTSFSENNGIYTQDIKLSDITGKETTTIENTIIMKLEDNYNFVMSFQAE